MLTIQKMSLQGFLTVLIMSVLLSGITYGLTFLKSQVSLNYYYLIYVFLFGLFLAVLALLIGKACCLLLFSVVTGILLFSIPQLSNSGTSEIVILFLAAFVFEILLFVAKRTSLGLVFAAVVSLATIPFTMLLLVGQFYETLLKSAINFSILCGILGFFAALLAIGIWEVIKARKFIIKLRVLS